MKSDSDIVKDLVKEQLSLKKRRYQLNVQIQSLYDRWKRNGIPHHGTTYVPLMAVLPLSRLLRNLGRVQRKLAVNRSLIKILTEIRRRQDDGPVHLQGQDN